MMGWKLIFNDTPTLLCYMYCHTYKSSQSSSFTIYLFSCLSCSYDMQETTFRRILLPQTHSSLNIQCEYLILMSWKPHVNTCYHSQVISTLNLILQGTRYFKVQLTTVHTCLACMMFWWCTFQSISLWWDGCHFLEVSGFRSFLLSSQYAKM